MTALEIIEKLKLEPHPLEGGYFRRTYESSVDIGVVDIGVADPEQRNRKLLSSIYYMLTNESPIGYLHKNKSDIIHYYHLGAPIKYVLVTPQGKLEEKILGPNLVNGEHPQLIVKGGVWKASKLCSGEFSLISEAVSPGFDYADNDVASLSQFKSLYPELVTSLKDYIR